MSASATLDLHADQRAALDLALDPGRRVCVVTGAPGTGKTTLVRAIVEHFERQDRKIVLGAPTGKAAIRLSQQTGRPASTIHRLLEPTRDRGIFRFSRNRNRPLELDVLVLDEVSMIDVRLAAKVLEALPPSARLVLVGDTNQLPAVGPGAILGDLIASGAVPTIRLDTIKRQNPGALITAIHAIKDGKIPCIANAVGDDLFVEEVDDETDIAGRVVDLVLERLPSALQRMFPERFAAGVDRLRDIQVLVPTRERGALGCKALNEAFQARLWRDEGTGRFRAGDKVIQQKNDYDNLIFNGDIGFVRGFDTDPDGRKLIEVAFENVAAPGGGGTRDRLVQLLAAQNELSLAYAITAHKAQGSEFPVVVIPLHSSMPSILLTRNWSYTAISRARHLCVLVGQRDVLGKSIRRVNSNHRLTALASMLRQHAPAPASEVAATGTSAT